MVFIMDSNIINLIGSVGFPIIMCLLMYKQLNDSNLLHKEEMNKMTEALNNNTLVLQQLSDKMENNKDE